MKESLFRGGKTLKKILVVDDEKPISDIVKFNLDKEKSQRLANQIFDSAVNCGVSATLKRINRVKNEMDSVKA